MENTVEKELELLLKLQNIDNQIDEIIKMRGDLPDEVKSLEAELANIQAQLQKDEEAISNLEQVIATQRIKIKKTEALVQRYEAQQLNVRNNKEYDAITKEIELQKLDIQLAEKKIKDCYEYIAKNRIETEQTSTSSKKKEQVFTEKQGKLQSVLEESQEKEASLHRKRARLVKKIDTDLLRSYDRIRKNVRNKLAVVLVKRGACSGCFMIVYPQVQVAIRAKKQIVSCEHCGRIIADVADPVIEEKNSEGKA
ncbi:MAG: C4-type zinc ribbon domain-containing protein [Bacteroidota bacterium]